MNDESVNHGAKSSVAKVEEMRESEQDPGVFWQVGSRSRRRPPRGPVLWRTRDTSWQVHGCVSWMIDVCVIGKQLSGEINTFLCGQNHHTEPALTLTVGIATEWKAQRSTPGRRVCASLWSRRRAEPYVFLFNGCAAFSLRQAGAALTVMVYLVAEQGLSRAQASAVAPWGL